MSLERKSVIQQPLSFHQTFPRWQDETVRNTDNSGGSTGKGPAKLIAGASVARPTRLVPLSIKTHPDVSTRRRSGSISKSTTILPSLSPIRCRVERQSLSHPGSGFE